MDSERLARLILIKQRGYAYACMFFWLLLRTTPGMPILGLAPSPWLKPLNIFCLLGFAICMLTFIFVSKDLRLKLPGMFPKELHTLGWRNFIVPLGIAAAFESIVAISKWLVR